MEEEEQGDVEVLGSLVKPAKGNILKKIDCEAYPHSSVGGDRLPLKEVLVEHVHFNCCECILANTRIKYFKVNIILPPA